MIEQPAKRPAADDPQSETMDSAFTPASDSVSGTWSGGQPPVLPATLGRYQLLRLLGKGGMGAVYLAHDAQMDRKVALKIPKFDAETSPEQKERFLREARACGSLSHPNICPMYDVGVIDGVLYMTMAFLEGQPLGEVIKAGPVSVRQAVEWTRLVALAMQEAHDHGIIHRDLKPANILINTRKQPIVMDFGLARREHSSSHLTQTGAILGTPKYMPPEQVNGDTKAMGPWCDVYSLGVILYEMLAGRPPFDGPLMDLMIQVGTVEAPPPSRFRSGNDPALEAICLKALAKQPAARHASMKAFATALQQWLARPATKAAPAMPVARPIARVASAESIPGKTAAAQPRKKAAEEAKPDRQRSARGLVAGIGGVVAVLVGLTIWIVLQVRSMGPAADLGAKATKPAPAARKQLARTKGTAEFVNSIGLTLVAIGPGEFLMGSPETDKDHRADEFQHKVKITRSFYLGIYPVTQAEYQRVMGSNPSQFRGDKWPVDSVSWEDAQAFCRKLSDLAEEKQALRFYRLPTEAEWEYACRAGTKTRFYTGDILTAEQANFDKHEGKTTEVGSYPPNPWGLYDMHGNVWQWCQDWYHENYYRHSPPADPENTTAVAKRVIRGGSWRDSSQDNRAAYRFSIEPRHGHDNLGFRVACDVGEPRKSGSKPPENDR